MARRGSSRPFLSLVTAVATFASYAGLAAVASPARAAADAETLALRGLVERLETFVPGLAGVGRLGQALPALDVAPAGPAGMDLATLLTQADATVLGADFDNAATVDQLVDAIDGADGTISAGRDVSFTAEKTTTGTVNSVTVGVSASRTVTTAKLDVRDDSPQFSLSTEGGVTLVLNFNASFTLNYDTAAGGAAWITRSGSTPSVTVSGSASIPDPGAIDAGLGILGAQLGAGTSLSLSALVTTAWADPDNDGRLYFDEPGGTTDDGELAAAGAGAGLVTAGLGAGSLDATLRVVARPSTAIDLGDVDVTVDVDAPDLTAGDPQVTVTSGTLDAVRAFLTLSTRDLAQGLAQAASTVMALQNATGVDLPFMRGDFSNAIGAVAAITEYLETNVPAPTATSPEPGLPTFASLQDMLEGLDAINGATAVDIVNAAYDAAKKKVLFQLDITRATGPAQPLNPAGEPLSGTGTYTDTTLTDAGKTFGADLVGRQVTAGTSAGIVASVSGDGHTLTLSPDPVTSPQNPSPTVFWNGGRPAPGTPYTIAAADPKIGAVELGNTLAGNAHGAIKNANAKVAQAMVTPSFTLHLPIVLDLREPDTTDCNPGAAVSPCPYSHTEDGITRIITSLPVTADRIMLRTGNTNLLTADAPITTNVDIDATVGFLGVKVKGTLKACTKSTGVAADCTGTGSTADHLLEVALKPVVGADADGDIPFTAFVGKLTDALSASPSTLSTLVGVTVKGQAYANLTVEVPGAPQFFGGTGPSAGVTVVMPDITAPGTVTVTPSATIGDLASFNLDPDNPLALFGAILANLQAVQGLVGDFPGSGALDTKIPLVGKSFNDVIGSGVAGGGDGVSYSAGALTDNARTFDDSFVGRRVHVGSQQATVTRVDPANDHRLLLDPPLTPVPSAGTPYTTDSELQGLINVLQDQSSNNLQELLNTLARQLGGGSNATFEVVDGTPDLLKLKLHWVRSYASKTPLNMKFQIPAGTDRSLVGAEGEGLLNVTASGEVNLALLIPLDMSTFDDPAGSLMVDPTQSNVKAGVSVNGDGVKLTANLGPFEATLGNPTGDPDTELQAGLGVELASSATSPQTLSAFAGGLGVDVTGNGVQCDGAPSGDVDLALCAVFPMRINGALAGSDEDHSKLVVRLPIDEDDLADTLNVLGAQVDGHDRVEFPDNLAGTLADAALNLLSFGDGFAGYLEFTERALRAASFEGKLPLVGKDLQAGADFIGGVREDIAAAFGGTIPADTSAGSIRTFLKDVVKPALPTVGPQFKVDVTCANPLPAAGAPNAAKAGSGSGTSYQYKIVAYTLVGGAKANTVTGPASATVDHVAVASLGDDENIALTWAAVDRATGYRVLRSVDGGAFFEIKDVGNATTYTDKGDDAPAAAPHVDVDPSQAPCADSTPADEVTGFTVEVLIGQGKPTTMGCETDATLPAGQKDCLSAEIPLDLGIPGLSIKTTDATDPISAKVGWRLHLKLGLDRTQGFYVDTQEGGSPEFLVGAELDVPDLQARLAFINVDSTNNDTATPEFKGTFSIDLHDSDSKLTLDQIISPSVTDHVTPTLTANVDIDWHLAARPGTGSALPGISADFALTWGWTSEAPSDIDNLDIAFNNVKLDAGEFLGNAIKPIIKQVVDVLKPIQPVLDTLFEPVPVLSDLSEAVGGDPITIASLAETFSTLAGEPNIGKFLAVVKNVRDLLKALSGDCAPDPSPCITVGSFKLVESAAVEKDANPSTAASLIDTGGPGYNLQTDVKQQVNAKASQPIDANGAGGEHTGFTFPFLDNPGSIFGLLVGQDVDLVKFDSGPLTLGFEFQQSFGPVYAPPPVNIVVGGGASVSLRIVAGFDTYGIRTAIERGKFDAKILDSLFFYTTDSDGKPLPVVQFEGYLQAGASVSVVVVEVGVVGGVKLTISFYWNDPNNDGKFRFSEFLATALTNPICLFNVGGELSLFIKVFITLGISPFSVSFDFTLVDVVILDFSLKPDCTPPPPKLGGVKDGVLYLFAGKFGGKAQRAPTFSGTYPFDANNTAEESWVIRQVPAKPAGVDPDGTGPKVAPAAESAKITVTALGISEDFDDDGGKITTVVLDGRGYAGPLQVTFNGGDKNTPFAKKVVVATGSGADVVRTGTGTAIVDTAGGIDQITTLERTDLSADPATAPTALVSGGADADAITVGNGRDTVLGDRGLVFHDQATISVTDASGGAVSVPAPLDPNDVDLPSDAGGNDGPDGADQIAAGLGGSTIYGNGGGDKIGTANDNPQADLPGIVNPSFYRAGANTIVGGGGGDRIKSGSASDKIYTGAKVDIGQDDVGSGDLSTDENSVDTGTGSDTVYGSNAKDFVTTHSLTSQTATVYGGDSADVIIGGLGTDRLYGGRANDYLVAGPATVSSDFPIRDELTAEGAGFARRVTLEPLTPPVSQKTLVGGGGKDRIYGVDGPATIYGDHEVDACVRQSDPVSAQPPQHPVVAPEPVANRDDADLVLGGAGVDTVQAGGGNDYVHLFGSADTACGNAGADRIFGGIGDDLVYGGSDADRLYGDEDDDELYANTGEDSVFGGPDDDRMQGNEDADFLTGGLGTDLVIGGTSKAGVADTGDRLYGDEGTDTLVGDNAGADAIPAYPADLADTTAPPTLGGADHVYGGAHDDKAYGGLDDDHVWGGGGADVLEGNNAVDRVYGEDGPDDIAGGSSESAATGVGRPDAGDFLYGGDADDVVAGDNALIEKLADGSPLTKGRALTSERGITLLDQGHGAAAGLFGGDVIEGGDDNDVILGQRGVDTVNGNDGDDYAEGGQDADTLHGDGDDDDLVGGSYDVHTGTGQARVGQLDTGDTITGDDGQDVALGDNGALLRDPAVPASDLTKNRGVPAMPLRSIDPYDLGTAPVAGTSGHDRVNGNGGEDVLLGQDGTDRLFGDAASDYAEGGADSDWLEGGTGSDDLVGGSSALHGADTGVTTKGQPDKGDVVWGQAGDDLAVGDNALVNRVEPYHELTYRIGTSLAGTIAERRSLRLLDVSNGDPAGILNEPEAIRFGADHLSGQAGVDVLLGQDGPDAISGGSDDDYAEGQGAGDAIFGDAPLAGVPVVATWPGLPTAGHAADGGADGQDDLIGGKSEPAYRDGADVVHGNGASDFVLGDNGTSVREILGTPGSLADRVYTLRYPATLPAGAAKIRVADSDFPSTRFCTTAQATCEPTGAYGGDTLYGEAGDDFVYGQDGGDLILGGDNDDDLYGELGNDRLFGEAGDDAILGDRGGVRDIFRDGSETFGMSVTQVPKVSFEGFSNGSVTRVTDLLHDVNGDAFVGSGTDPAMPHPGLHEGGDDRIRGGTGHDSVHAGFGDDLANGDSGGDWVFGDDGADVLWGGKGCDETVDTPASAPYCYPGGIFDPAPHNADGSTVAAVTDYILGGKGGTSAASIAGSNGSDILDWRPRGSYAVGTGCTAEAWPVDLFPGGKKGASTTLDPCAWFEMTDITSADTATYQHHQGVDWQYGGWDRDVLQGDVADNGPNEGDRLLDWDGAYNLYTHCNAAYGGFNDVRQHSPTWQDFLQRWVFAQGAGQAASDATTAGTSAFVELALVYPGVDREHGSGRAYPATPGHFDNPNACAP